LRRNAMDGVEYETLESSRATKILSKMRQRNCGIKLRDQKASREFLQERYEQLKLEGREKSKECEFIRHILGREKS
jgi:hypothetical protein